MTTYTITQAQMDALEWHTDPHSILRSLKPNSQEPIAYMDADGNTSDNNDSGCFNIKLFDHPAPISKEDAERVLELLKVYKEYAPPMAYGNTTVVEALTIMQRIVGEMK